jgi:hypothetical protein
MEMERGVEMRSEEGGDGDDDFEAVDVDRPPVWDSSSSHERGDVP